MNHPIIQSPYKTLYKTAKLPTKEFCSVIGQDSIRHEQVKFLLLKVDGGSVWWPIDQIQACL